MIKQEILSILPAKLREVICEYPDDFNENEIEEIRLRCNRPVLLIGGKGEKQLKITLNEANLREAMEYISGYSLYAYEEQLKEGFITIRGGHRIGMAGRVVVENGKIKTIKNISSLNIRISHQIQGCSDEIMKYIKGNVLIISPPRMGKTTLLRDILRNISEKEGEAVGIVDERSEIGACYMGIPQNNLGPRSDILDCCPKAAGMILLLRSMSPTYIGVDELGTNEDIESVKQVINSGSYVAATIHGEDIEDIKKKKNLREIFENNMFDTYIQLGRKELGGRSIAVYNKSLEMVKEI